MTREQISESLSAVFWLRHNMWMTLFNHKRCGICNYPKELDMSDFERELRAAWESQGGCRTGVDPEVLEDMDWQDAQCETAEEIMEKLIASWPSRGAGGAVNGIPIMAGRGLPDVDIERERHLSQEVKG